MGFLVQKLIDQTLRQALDNLMRLPLSADLGTMDSPNPVRAGRAN